MKVFRRLLGFLRPYRAGVIASLLLAAAAMGTGVLIPFLIGRTIDDIRQGGDSLWLLGGVLVAAGVLRLVFSVVRRLVAGRVSLGVEFDLRNLMYRHLQSLELGFFDGQQTGQLMSRSTVDLQSVRFFLGYGLIFMMQALLTIVIAAAVMVAVNPMLAAVALAPMPLVIWAAARYGRLNRPASQEVQQRIAELTAEAEENVGGVRVVKAFAQERRQVHRFDRAVTRVFDQSMVSTRLRAFYNPLIGFLPQLGLAAIMLVGGRQAINGTISVGDFVAFYGYVVMLTGPMRMLGVSLGMAQRAVASGNRVFEILDREPQLTAPAGRRAAAGRRRPGADARRVLRLRRRHRGAARHRPGRARRAAPWPWWAPPGRARARWSCSSRACTTSTAGEVMIDGVDVRDVDLASLRHEIALVSDDAFLFSATLRDNIAYARPDATDEEVERGRPPRRPGRGGRRPARGLRHAGGRARPDPVRRPAPAGGHRPGAAGGARAC